MPPRSQNTRPERWIGTVLLALAPLWAVGKLLRGLWTPDEPRVADIAWRMAGQHHWALAHLAGRPFLEEPPLSYWAAALCARLLGDHPDVLRLPNLLYAVILALAMGALGFALDGAPAAVVAALVAGSAITAFRVSMWLAPDDCLLAACAVALLGAYLGYTAPRGRRKFLGYLLMHAGAAAGFMAKSAVGWLVPGLALLTLIAWERRWTELRRAELYAGFLLQALLIAPWLIAVADSAHGAHALRVLFWYNLAGRFVRIAAPPAYQYANGHRNAFGRYFLQLPVYLLPWTALAAAALRQAWARCRLPASPGTVWRFAICAALPWLLLLSLAATARDVYAAPALLGCSLLIALWTSEMQQLAAARSAPAPGGALRWTRWIAALAAVAFAAVATVMAAIQRSTPGIACTDLALGAGVLVGLAITLPRAARAQARAQVLPSVLWPYTAYAAAFCLSAFALLNPDETTIAALDRGLDTGFTTLEASAPRAAAVVAAWFAAHGPRSRVLVLLPGHAPGPFTPLLRTLGARHRRGDGVAEQLQAADAAVIVRRYDLPHGRRYALLAPPHSASTTSAARAPAQGDIDE